LERNVCLMTLGQWAQNQQIELRNENTQNFLALLSELKTIVVIDEEARVTAHANSAKIQKRLAKAQRGDAKAQFKLATANQFADNVQDRNYEDALYWYYNLLSQASPDVEYKFKAMNNVAIMYMKGQAVERSEQRAFEWWACAELEMVEVQKNSLRILPGHEHVQFNLAMLALNSDEENLRNYEVALRRFLKATTDPVSVVNIGVLYATGMGVEQDFQAARNWFAKCEAFEECRVYPVAEHNAKVLSLLGCISDSGRWEVDSSDCEYTFVKLRNSEVEPEDFCRFAFVEASKVCKF